MSRFGALEHAGVGEYGRPRHPVTVKIVGSNPIVGALASLA